MSVWDFIHNMNTSLRSEKQQLIIHSLYKVRTISISVPEYVVLLSLIR
jgi:hypothetical protein